MDIALEPDIPTHSGGLGVLAGDTFRAAADLTAIVATSQVFPERITPSTAPTRASGSFPVYRLDSEAPENARIMSPHTSNANSILRVHL